MTASVTESTRSEALMSALRGCGWSGGAVAGADPNHHLLFRLAEPPQNYPSHNFTDSLRSQGSGLCRQSPS
jgi:hypothetical protein